MQKEADKEIRVLKIIISAKDKKDGILIRELSIYIEIGYQDISIDSRWLWTQFPGVYKVRYFFNYPGH